MSKTVVIADDHGLVASGLAAELTTHGFDVAATVSNGIDAIAAIRRMRPDCAVLDLGMPGANGCEVFLEAKRWSPETRFVIVTGNPAPGVFAQLLQTGIDGLFLKSEDAGALCRGIAEIARGRTIISAGAAKLLQLNDATSDLTNRELQVLHAIARGLSNAGIAQDLGVSAKTVDSHRTNMMQKLRVHSTAALLMKAMNLGLLSVDDDM